ncbi:Down syndrome cell adhesion molecule homolog [Xenia sp. Carnegie-2017]|uniref:Down syndrome cell adhesion molecule homolog n=1 Tax=Xenia sp. Carnegie-2017 TaxID=2897299 RepID=UPI001F04BF51|nr:Down syndrome cell adhesion molecule homolog [Xenia sp. Carnegie-2017]
MALTPNTNYRFRLVARTSRGEGIPKVLEVKTKSVKTKPDPPTIVGATARNNDVILIWRDQFDGNTPITQYIVEYRISSGMMEDLLENPWTNGWNLKPSQTVRNRTDGTRSAVLENLQALTVYWFRMITRNEAGLSIPGNSSSSVSTGIAKSARQSAPTSLLKKNVYTFPSFRAKPDPPTIVGATARNNDVILIWRDQFDGNTPITQYIVEYRTSSEKNPWTNGWNLKPSQTVRNRTDGTRSAVLENLQALTVYWFRMITRNEAGLSIPGNSSSSVSTGIAKSARQSAPVYEEVWFISVMAVIGFLILLLCLVIICCCCCCKRQRSQSKTLTHPISMDVRPKNGMRSHPNDEETLSKGSSRTHKDEKPLLAMKESEQEDEDDKKEESTFTRMMT